MRCAIPNNAELRKQYLEDYDTRALIIKDLETHIEQLLSSLSSHFTIKGRVKSFHSFYKKYLRYLKSNDCGAKNGGAKDCDDKTKIPDEIGIRIVCPFLDDISAVQYILREKFAIIEVETKTVGSFKEFGYESQHILIEIPAHIGKKYQKKSGGDFSGEIAEIQVRTNLQDAWAEVEHELVYKARFTPFDNTMRRKLAAINACFSLADTIFQEFRTYQKQMNNQLEQRRTDFYSKIEGVNDQFLFDMVPVSRGDGYIKREFHAQSIDELLLNALYAHNKGQFKDAEFFYSRILELQPEQKLESLVHKHRGMASFAQSHYNEAIIDFKKAQELDADSPQSAYYLGVVYSCLREYENAIEAFNSSILIDPFQKYCFFRRAQCYYHLSDYPQALYDCEAAISLDSEFEAAKKFKEILLDKLKM